MTQGRRSGQCCLPSTGLERPEPGREDEPEERKPMNFVNPPREPV